MPVVFFRQIGNGMAFIAPLAGPDHGLPGGGHIDNTLPGMGGPVDPGYGRPDWGGGRPDNSLPGGWGRPDNTLPGTPPPSVPADTVLVLVRSTDGKWHYATVPAGAPPTTLPEPPPTAEPKAAY